MKRLNKSLRKTKQRSRKHHARRHTRRNRSRNRNKQRGGSLPVPAGALVGMSTGGEYGVPILMSKEKAEAELERGGLEE
jgi:chemotaxis response regulator CheB